MTLTKASDWSFYSALFCFGLGFICLFSGGYLGDVLAGTFGILAGVSAVAMLMCMVLKVRG